MPTLVLLLVSLAAPPALTDEQVRARALEYVSSLDLPVTAAQWRELGPRAGPVLEELAQNREQLPTRRSAALAGLACLGGSRARSLLAEIAAAEDEPFAVRQAAIRSAPLLLADSELVASLEPILEGARELSVRAVAAETLARHAVKLGCPAVRAQAAREGEVGFRRALAHCAAATP